MNNSFFVQYLVIARPFWSCDDPILNGQILKYCLMARHLSLKNKKIYLDYAATTPVDALVEKAMRPYFTGKFGNPGSLHFFGQEVMAAVDESREKIAKVIGANFREIIFTGSATEANNLALRGVVKYFDSFRAVAFRNQNNFAPAAKFSFPSARRSPASGGKDQAGAPAGYSSRQSALNQNISPLRIIISSVEHESILETAKDLEKEGVEVIYLPVNKKGFVNLKKLEKSLNERTILVSVMYANNEIGTIQPIVEIAKIIQEFRIQNLEFRDKHTPKSYILNPKFYPFFHTDAVQAFQYLDCDVNKLGIDMMTLSGHKIYGPKGIGALYVRNSKHETRNSKQIQNSKFKVQNNKVSDLVFRISDLPAVQPLVTGGGQEFGLRSGTENVPLIVGFAKAVELAVKNREKETVRVKALRDYFWQGLKKIESRLQINGSLTNRLPNNLNVYWPGQSAEDLLVRFDLAGLAVSSGSACSARSTNPSHVLSAIGCNEKRIRQSLRFTLGKFTHKPELDEALKRIKILINRK